MVTPPCFSPSGGSSLCGCAALPVTAILLPGALCRLVIALGRDRVCHASAPFCVLGACAKVDISHKV